MVGVFNARAGTSEKPCPVLSGETGPSDVVGLNGEAFASFRHTTQTLERLSPTGRVSIALGERGYEVMTFVPIERDFAAIGLGNMLNSHGAVRAVSWMDERTVTVTLADGGLFVAHSAKRPTAVRVAAADTGFEYDAAKQTLRVTLSHRGRVDLAIQF
jgi:hypothetical protein